MTPEETPIPANPNSPYITIIASAHDIMQLILPRPLVAEDLSLRHRTAAAKAKVQQPQTVRYVES